VPAAVLAQVVLVEAWAVELAEAGMGAQADLAARVARQERPAAVRAKEGPVAEDRAVEDPVELEELVVSAVLAA